MKKRRLKPLAAKGFIATGFTGALIAAQGANTESLVLGIVGIGLTLLSTTVLTQD